MRRDIAKKLLSWKQSKQRKPLVLCGARQVGKTYSLMAFGEEHYDEIAYINFFDEDAAAVLRSGYNAKQILSDIRIYTGTTLKPGKTLIVLDEIQEQPQTLALMKDFCENTPEHHIVSAGSYLGISHHAGVSFPVGKVNLLDMYPLSFLEFLSASGDQALAEEVLVPLDFKRMAQFSKKLERKLRQYFYIGGMPEVVAEFINSDDDFVHARNLQKDLLQVYDKDFSKYADNRSAERMRLAFDSISAHLGRENHKFVFGHIAKGARARDYETAVQSIVDSGLAARVYRLAKVAKPLKFYRDLSAFKLYLHDVGLLGCALETDLKDVILSNNAFEEYRGAMTEQYVCQQLIAGGNTPYYWSAQKGSAEVDFVVMKGKEPAPLEVKAEENLRSKSLRMLCEKTGLHGYRASMSDYREQEWMTNIPLWAVGTYFAPEATKLFCS